MWIIVRTEFKKEKAVAEQIEKKGFPVWVPFLKVRKRTAAGRKHMDRSNVTVLVGERPVCPGMVFAVVPSADIDRILGIRHLDKVEQTFESTWALVPDEQIKVFRAAVEAENLAIQMLTAAAQRKRKAKWRTLQDAFEDLVAAVKGPVEQAA